MAHDDAIIDYWRDALGDALCQIDKYHILSAEEQTLIAKSLADAADSIQYAFPSPPSPYPREIERLEKALKTEREKIVCPHCYGEGRIITYFGTFQSNSTCYKCHGEGKISP